MYLFEVKTPGESTKPWDYYKVRATIPAGQAFWRVQRSAEPALTTGRLAVRHSAATSASGRAAASRCRSAASISADLDHDPG